MHDGNGLAELYIPPLAPPTPTRTNTPAGPTPTRTPTATPTTSGGGGGANISIEAEAGNIEAPFTIASDAAASGGQYIVDTTLKDTNCASASTGYATYTFNIAVAGTYRVWARTIAPSSSADSFCVQMDGGTSTAWTVPNSTAWTWQKVLNTQTWSLSAGTHTLRIRYREENTKLDKLIITSDMGFTPSGLGMRPGAAKVYAKPAAQAGTICAAYGITRNGCIARQYIYFNGQRVAVRTRTDANATGTVTYLHQDHLGSSTLATTSGGAAIAESVQRYRPYGEPRYSAPGLPTDYTFTGQRSFVSGIGLMHYGARFYDPSIGRFISADTIVPGAGNPQALNRYAYVLNRPLNYIDPTGHAYICAGGCDDPDQGVGWSLNEVGNYYRPSADPDNEYETYRQQSLVMEAAVNIHNAGRQRITSQAPDDIKEYGIALLLAGAEQRLSAAGYGASSGSSGLTSAFAGAGVLGSFARSLNGGGGGGGAVNRHDPNKPTYYRVPSDPYEIEKVMKSGEVWGRERRNGFGGGNPAVKAYRGYLPKGQRGYEFQTDVLPDDNGHPGLAQWTGPRPGVTVDDEWAKIKCTVTKIC